ncbi:MAG: MAPEG family protein [Myxococcota bacterium]|nr:hypothetical protein [Deltaproteobacteria bacterium]MCP4239753.1 MAPEG family protein [bacterium]MDP6074471.1 MAPEG family protein [Myxococcota bacterium]MDP6241715.1 MAPEG family protein [Myxococcota bacterium]MDP7073856.1 MAPEG family protein [Myxococcota bacterium]
MQLVAVVIGLALMEYVWFSMRCGQVRGRSDVAAPAMSGDPEFERALRVQYNTIEQLVVFVPSMLLFGFYVDGIAAAGVGLVFILGRYLYARAYWVDPANRGPGFLLTVLSNAVLLLGGVVGAIVSYAT